MVDYEWLNFKDRFKVQLKIALVSQNFHRVTRLIEAAVDMVDNMGGDYIASSWSFLDAKFLIQGFEA